MPFPFESQQYFLPDDFFHLHRSFFFLQCDPFNQFPLYLSGPQYLSGTGVFYRPNPADS